MCEECKLICEEPGERIDRFLSGKMQEFSRSYIQKLLKEGAVSVNGASVKPNYKTGAGDQICIRIPEPEVLDVLPE